MMKRKDKIEDVLISLTRQIQAAGAGERSQGFTASEIAAQAGFDRTNTSKELNRLVAEGKAVKSKGRPVYYRAALEAPARGTIGEAAFLSSAATVVSTAVPAATASPARPEDVFAKIVGFDHSLELVIKQAKAAVLYPPKGLHCLLTGPTGVGKTTFAEVLFEYSKQQGMIEPDKQLITFNCAEYADNPGLLLSHLFGHVQGAFTGASKDKKGLVDMADGGMLLLDEVHRLHPEGQEMLFMLMDKGEYKRLGETEETRRAEVLILCATTEDVDSALLKTFTRRIPMILRLPSLGERSLAERLALIETFFCDEYLNVKTPIHVHKRVLRALLLYDCSGNIGQLKGDIQILCARGFLDFKIHSQPELTIHTAPEHIQKGLFRYQQMREELHGLLDYDKEYFVFDTQKNSESVFKENTNTDFCVDIIKKYDYYLNRGYSEAEIDQVISRDLKSYLEQLLDRGGAGGKLLVNKEEIYKAVSRTVYDAVEIAFEVARQKLGKEFNLRVKIALALHISALMERIEKGKVIYKEELNQIALNSPLEFQTAKLMRSILENELMINIPKEEISFITMFLKLSDEYDLDQNRQLSVIVIAHGRQTATSIAEVVNTLLGIEDCHSVDMPLTASVEETLNNTVALVRSLGPKKGVLLMVDMGSLTGFAEIVTEQTGIPARSVEMVSTPVVLEAMRKAQFPEVSLDELAAHVREINPYLGRRVVGELKQRLGILPPREIITTCLTGEGTAIKIAGFLEQNIPGIQASDIKLTPLNPETFQSYSVDLQQVVAVVGAVQLPLSGVPFIALDEVILGDGLKRLERLIGTVPAAERVSREGEDKVIVKMLAESLVFLNPHKAYEVVSEAYETLVAGGLLPTDKRTKIQFLLHNCCLVERAIQNRQLGYSGIEAWLLSQRELVSQVRQAFVCVEEVFGIEIADTEIGYILDLVDTHKTRSDTQ